MTNILIAGFQHETNTFAPSLADWAAFERGDSFPAYIRGAAMVEALASAANPINIPVGGFAQAARERGWALIPSLWAGAIPSSYVTHEAFERIADEICADVRAALQGSGGLQAVYLDLHGAAVAQHVDDTEGELIARIRAIVGPEVPIVASLDLHANVTLRMLQVADALVSYRTYPHVDMQDTGRLAAQLLERRMAIGHKEPMHLRRLPFLIPLNAQSTDVQPAQHIYDALRTLDAQHDAVLSFCMGFPAADIEECAPMVWGYGAASAAAVLAVEALYARAAEPGQWRPDYLDAADAVALAIAHAATASAPIVMADTQDNPGGGGDSNTSGLLHELLRQGAGKLYPGQVAIGLIFDPDSAAKALDASVNSALPATISIALGKSVPIWGGRFSDPPVQGAFTVRAVSDGVCTLTGPMMKGLTVHLGPSACLEIEGILVAVVSGKKQMLDRALFRMVGIEPGQMKIVVVKSSNHFRADFGPMASEIIVAKADGPLAADPADLPWRKLSAETRTRP